MVPWSNIQVHLPPSSDFEFERVGVGDGHFGGGADEFAIRKMMKLLWRGSTRLVDGRMAMDGCGRGNTNGGWLLFVIANSNKLK